jgi:hypothetical protein
MTSNKGNGTKGFAGLDSMLSDVETPATAQTVEAKPAPLPKPQIKEPTRGQPTSLPPAPSKKGSAKYWLIGVGVLVLFAWGAGRDKNSSSSYPPPAPATEVATDSNSPSPSPAYAAEPVPAADSNDEEKPPVASGLSFSRNQIRYCLSEDIRMSAWQEQVNQNSQSSVDAFNLSVNDYNIRCSNFRYRRGTLESVRSEVEANRPRLQLQGISRAEDNP